MTASAWIALGSLGFLMMLHAVAGAFFAGKQSQRITNLERDVGDRSSMSDTVIELKVKMDHAEAQLNKIGHNVESVNRQLATLASKTIGWELK